MIENHRVPAAVQMLWYKVGAADEARGESGVAHVLEHLMFKGTDDVPGKEFSSFVRRYGGRENAFTSWDYTAYYQVVPVDQLGQVMAFEAGRMRGLALEPEEIASERSVVLEEWNERIAQNPSAKLGIELAAALYRNHNYGRPIIGWRHELKGLDRETVLNFYQRYYAPDNAILVVAGDVTPDDVKKLAEEHYGSIPPSNNPPEAGTVEPPPRAERRVILQDERVADPSWRRSYLAPSRGTEGSEHVLALEVLAEILGDSSVGRLAKNLVRGSEQATYASIYYDGDRRGPTSFSIYAAPRRDVSMENLEKAIEDEIRALLRDGVSEEEVTSTVKRLRAAAVYARDDLETAARVLGRTLAIGGTVKQVETWPERLESVTAEDVVEAAESVLRSDNGVTGELLPKEPES